MSECYYAFDDDYYNSIYCDLPEGHSGPHRASYEWETRAYDICVVEGHQWGDWEAVAPERIAGFMPRLKEPTRQRKCTRCGHIEDDAEYPQIFPVSSILNRLPVRKEKQPPASRS